MEIEENDFHLGVWFGYNKTGDDILVHVLKRDKRWRIFLRTRIRKDNKIFDSQDIKKSHEATYRFDEHTPDEVYKNTQGIIEDIKSFFPFVEYVDIRGNNEKFMFVMAQQEWAHIQKVDASTDEGKSLIKKLQEESNGKTGSCNSVDSVKESGGKHGTDSNRLKGFFSNGS